MAGAGILPLVGLKMVATHRRCPIGESLEHYFCLSPVVLSEDWSEETGPWRRIGNRIFVLIHHTQHGF